MTIRINVETVLFDRSDPSQTIPYAVILKWSEADPIAARIYFCDAKDEKTGADIEWVVSRQMLSAGLAAPTGTGDIELWPETGWIVLRLKGPDREITLHGDPGAFIRFLCGTYEAIPADKETMPELDWELTAFLKGAASQARNACPFCGTRPSGHNALVLDHRSDCRVLEIHMKRGEK